MGRKLAAHLRCALTELPARLDNHLLRLDLNCEKRLSADGTVSYDWWGAGWHTQSEGYSHAHAPLGVNHDLSALQWPDAEDLHLLDDARRLLRADNRVHFAVPNFGFALFERAWSLRGFDRLLMDLATEPGWVEQLLEIITQIQVRLAQRFVALGVNCGILDQYTSCVGRCDNALLLDCRDLSSRLVALSEDLQIVVCNTKFQRQLAGSEYGKRRAQCEEGARLLGVGSLRELTRLSFEQAQHALPAEVAKRCRFIVQENERVLLMAGALETGDHGAIRRHCAESFRGACELYEISVPAMRAMMEAILEAPGVIGARQAGAGFGGCMVAFIEQGATNDFIRNVIEGYRLRTQILPEIRAVSAATGAGVLREPAL